MTDLNRRALLASLAAVTLAPNTAAADDALKIAIGQRGGWEQCVSELGQNKGFFKKQGLTLELLYTQGSAETLQSVISNSVDIGIGLGTHGFLGAFLKGAPLRGIGASFTSADEQYYYVLADSPIKSIKDAGGKTIAISTNGSASNMFALHLARHFGVDLKPQPSGNYTSSLTQVLTKQLDIGFSAAPFNLNYVDDGRIRIIARGSDVPALRDMTSRLLVVNVAGLQRKKDILRRYMAAYHETLDWMYADPAAIDAYAEWSKLPKAVAQRAPEYMTRKNMEPLRISGLPGIMDDAVKFKYIPAPLTEAQLEQAFPLDELK
jgi:NitT/TauT family transport system substrate-binding protein